MKEDGLVLHSFRNTMITRLGQAGVPAHLYQDIVAGQSGEFVLDNRNEC
jgi:hypothetical protein